MNWFIASGAVSLGLVVGWMAGQTFVRLKSLDVTALGAVVGVMVGAAVIGLFQQFVGDHSAGYPSEIWLYPVGLLAGVFVAVWVSSLQQRKADKIRAKVETNANAKAAEEAKLNSARAVVVALLTSHGWDSISYEGIRRSSKQPWTDEFLSTLIVRFPDTFRGAPRVKTKGGVLPGLRLILKP